MPDVMPEASAKVSWPAWFYGPGGQSQIFESEDEVPEGWHDSPAKVGDDDAKKEVVKNTEEPSRYDGMDEAALIAELKGRDKVEFSEKWGKPRLVKALLDDDKKGK